MAPAKSRRLSGRPPLGWRAERRFATAGGVKVLLTPQGRRVEIERAKRVMDLLEQLSITPGTVLVIRAESLLTDDARLSATDEIELRSVVSGG